jgi:hypothetical protein
VFAGVEVKEECAALGMGLIVWERAALARRVSPRSFDFDDFGAEVGEELGAVGRSDILSEFEYT